MTQSPDYIAGYAQGWADKSAGRANAFPPTPTPVPIPPPTPTAIDLARVFANAAPGDNQLPAGTFNVPVGLLDCKVAGAAFRGNGKTKIVFQTRPGISTGISVHAADVTIDGVIFGSDRPIATFGTAKVNVNCVRTYAPRTVVSNCAATDIDGLVFFEPQANGGAVMHCAALDRSTRGDFIFVGGASEIIIDSCPGKDSPFTGSHNEHWIRIDANPSTGENTAARVKIQNCALRNFTAKESLAVRTAQDGIVVDNCDFYAAWTRAGQVAPAGAAAPALSVKGISFTACRFHEKAYIQIDQGVTAMIEGAFDNFAGYCPIHAKGPHVNLVAWVKLVDMPNQPGINHDMILMDGLAPGDVARVNGVEMNVKK